MPEEEYQNKGSHFKAVGECLQAGRALLLVDSQIPVLCAVSFYFKHFFHVLRLAKPLFS